MSGHAAHGRVYGAWSVDRNGWNPHFCAPMLHLAFGYLEGRTPTNGVILDLGCGDGQVAHAFAAGGFRALGVDIDLMAIAASAVRHPPGRFVAASMTDLPVADSCTDAVFAFSSFQYGDRTAILKECARVLRPGAPFAVVENMTANPVAVLERWRTRHQNGHDAQGSPAKVHLRPNQLGQFERAIGPASCEYFHLVTPVLLAFGGAFDASRPPTVRSRFVRVLYMYVLRIDRWLLTHLRFLQRFAWQVLITGHRATSRPMP